MDIDTMKRQGLCFNCKQKGHLSKDCKELKKPRVFFNRNVNTEKKEEKTDIDINSMTDAELGSYYRNQILGFQKGRA
jgi:hypothetical protein